MKLKIVYRICGNDKQNIKELLPLEKLTLLVPTYIIFLETQK